ncbi:28215_t:CDS:2, partial [Racocetra persica]
MARLCAVCRIKEVYIENGYPTEFCSHNCRKAAVDRHLVEACIVCRIYPRVLLQTGTRSPYCGKNCQAKATAYGSGAPPTRYTTPTRPPIQQGFPRPVLVSSPVSTIQPGQVISVPPPLPVRQPVAPVNVNRPFPMNQGQYMSPMCVQCKVKPRWRDQNTGQLSLYCGKTCKDKATGLSRISQNYNAFPTTIASNGIPTQIGIQQQQATPLNLYQPSQLSPGVQPQSIPMNLHQQAPLTVQQAPLAVQQTTPFMNVHQQSTPVAGIQQQTTPVSVQQQAAAMNIQQRTSSLNAQQPINVHQQRNSVNIQQPTNVHQQRNSANFRQRPISQQSTQSKGSNRQRNSYQNGSYQDEMYQDNEYQDNDAEYQDDDAEYQDDEYQDN